MVDSWSTGQAAARFVLLSVKRKECWTGGRCSVGDFTILPKHLIVEFTEDGEIIRGFAIPDFENFRISVHSPKKAKCASTTKSTTSSVALTSWRSQNQSTAISADAMVSNMKDWRSVRLESEKSFVLFMVLLLHTRVKTRLTVRPVCELVGQPLSLCYFPPKDRDNTL